jgi:hypothetical protein
MNTLTENISNTIAQTSVISLTNARETNLHAFENKSTTCISYFEIALMARIRCVTGTVLILMKMIKTVSLSARSQS